MDPTFQIKSPNFSTSLDVQDILTHLGKDKRNDL